MTSTTRRILSFVPAVLLLGISPFAPSELLAQVDEPQPQVAPGTDGLDFSVPESFRAAVPQELRIDFDSSEPEHFTPPEHDLVPESFRNAVPDRYRFDFDVQAFAGYGAASAPDDKFERAFEEWKGMEIGQLPTRDGDVIYQAVASSPEIRRTRHSIVFESLIVLAVSLLMLAGMRKPLRAVSVQSVHPS